MTRVGFQIVVYESRHAAVPTAAVDLNDLIAAPFARLHSVGTSAQHGQTFVQTLTFKTSSGRHFGGGDTARADRARSVEQTELVLSPKAKS